MSARRAALFAVLIAAAHLGAAVWTNKSVLQDYANAGDEYAYQISAVLFASGRLAAESPPPPIRHFFDVVHVINDGRFYGKYPPGWPAMLAVGEWLGAPWLVDPLLGAACVLAVYAFARRRWGEKTACIAAVLFAASPFTIFHSASYFSHTPCLLTLTLAADFLLAAAAPGGRARDWLLGGLFAGIAFSIRQYTVLVVLAPIALIILAALRDSGRRGELLRGLVLASLPFAACLVLLLAYNHAQTGDALLSPFQKYSPTDRLGIPMRWDAWAKRFPTHVTGRIVEMERWFPFAMPVALAGLLVPAVRGDRTVWLLVGMFPLLLAAYFFYWSTGGLQYGPRYLFEISGLLAVAAAVVLSRLGPRTLACALVVILASDGLRMRSFADETRRSIWHKLDIDRTVADARVSNALVFITAPSGGAAVVNLPRNGVDFDRPVLLVRDHGPENVRLLAAYPGRSAWKYAYDPRVGHGTLTPYEPDAAPRG